MSMAGNEEQGDSRRVVPERIGVAGIWCRNGQVLLTRRAAGISYANLWCFPGGGIDPGEDEERALLREWREEIGTSVRILRKIGSSDVSNGRFLLHWYLVQGQDEPLRPNPAEVAEVRWVDVAALGKWPDLLASNRQLIESLGPEGLTGPWHALPHVTIPCDAPAGSSNPSTPHAVWQDLQEQMENLRRDGMYRILRTAASPAGRTFHLDDGRHAINFASNDYLALASDARIGAAVCAAVQRWGWGSGGSQLICGRTSAHADLEKFIVRFKNVQAAIALPTGYMANLAAIRTLAASDDVILLDKLNHASIIDGASSCGAHMRVFPHRNYTKLESLLQRYASARRRVIVTDTLFSMDGDVADLPELVRLKQRYNAMLIIDEAHATGMLGPRGRGLAELQGVEEDIDVTVGTLSKALGGMGGFICGSRLLIEAVVNLARPFIFTTSMPAASCAAALAALNIVENEPQRREQALMLARYLRERLTDAGWNCGQSVTQIVPVMIGAADKAVAMSSRLLAQGYFVPAIRPPAVPSDGARLRISITAGHAREDIDGLLTAMGPRDRVD